MASGRIVATALTVFWSCQPAWVSAADPADEVRSVNVASDDKPHAAEAERVAQGILNDVVQQAFAATHDGWSSDEVLLNDELNARFLVHCRQQLPDAADAEFNWTLLNLRKAGKLADIKATKRRHDRHDAYVHAAEIAARFLYDKHQVSTDRVLCDPKLRSEFDRVATAAAPGVPAYELRKAAFGLRKARRLRPELVVRVADWGKEVRTFSAEAILADPKLVPRQPGIYIFRDDTGYLYIGESSDLYARVTQHLDHSDRKSLAHYLWQNGNQKITVELHVFDPNSSAKNKTVRRAYESELIASRKPRFNLAP